MSSIDQRRQAIFERVMARCARDEATGCLIWQGPTSGDGRGGFYPRMSLNGRTVAVHIVMASHWFGYIPANRRIDHTCKNRLCLEREHLDIVSHGENCRRRDGKPPRRLRE